MTSFGCNVWAVTLRSVRSMVAAALCAAMTTEKFTGTRAVPIFADESNPASKVEAQRPDTGKLRDDVQVCWRCGCENSSRGHALNRGADVDCRSSQARDWTGKSDFILDLRQR